LQVVRFDKSLPYRSIRCLEIESAPLAIVTVVLLRRFGKLSIPFQSLVQAQLPEVLDSAGGKYFFFTHPFIVVHQ
jgi:hypothetical protein